MKIADIEYYDKATFNLLLAIYIIMFSLVFTFKKIQEIKQTESENIDKNQYAYMKSLRNLKCSLRFADCHEMIRVLLQTDEF